MTTGSAYDTEAEAHAAVDQLLADGDGVTVYADGVCRRHVASHRELERLLSGAGLDDATVAKDVAALHHGRVLVLVTAQDGTRPAG